MSELFLVSQVNDLSTRIVTILPRLVSKIIGESRNLDKLDKSPVQNQDFSQFFKCWPSSKFLMNVRDFPHLEKGTNRHWLYFKTSPSTWHLSSLIGWNWIIASKSRITFLHYFHKNLLCYNESWLSRKPALKINDVVLIGWYCYRYQYKK